MLTGDHISSFFFFVITASMEASVSNLVSHQSRPSPFTWAGSVRKFFDRARQSKQTDCPLLSTGLFPVCIVHTLSTTDFGTIIYSSGEISQLGELFFRELFSKN
jgi:hypothetical protein